MKTNANDPTEWRYTRMGIAGNEVGGVKEADLSGLTKREYFAALAMQGLLATSGDVLNSASFASVAVSSADALIEALNKADR